jgi:predicted PurR-regulated permease PerM
MTGNSTVVETSEPSPQLAAPAALPRQLVVAAFFVVLLFLLYQAGALLAPFVTALAWAGIAALITHPLYRKLRGLLGGRSSLAATLMTLAALVVIVIPTVLILTVLAAQVVDLGHAALDFVQSGRWTELQGRLQASPLGRAFASPLLAGLDLRAMITQGIRDMTASVAAQLGGLLRDALVFVVNLVIVLFSLFFLYRDGEDYYRDVMDILPFPYAQKVSIAERLRITFSAIVNGVFLVALLQGAMTGIGLALFGVPYAVAWGSVSFVLALLPIVGAPGVWIPAAAWLYFHGETGAAAGLAVWSALLVSLPDNFLKPMLIGGRTKLPTFFLFLGLLGGLAVYGFLGILFGPLIVTALATFLQIYRAEYTGTPGGEDAGPQAVSSGG